MVTFLYWPAMIRGFFIAGQLILFFGMIWLVFLRWFRTHSLKSLFVPFVLTALLTIDIYFLSVIQEQSYLNSTLHPLVFWFRTTPLLWHKILFVFTAIYAIIFLWREEDLRKKSISASSIAEALDNLPDGLCFSKPDGRPILTNRTMYKLAQIISGHSLRNIEFLWKLVEERQNKEVEHRILDFPVCVLPDGSIWYFSRTLLHIEDKCFTQTVATDITEYYMLSQELAEKNQLLDEQHERLRQLMERIAQITQEKEVIASKVRVHSSFGQCVLTTRRYLAQGFDEEDLTEIVEMWQDVIDRIEVSTFDSVPIYDDTLNALLKASEALGCTIVFDGELPQDEELRYLIIVILREALINAVRHANANKIWLTLKTEGSFLLGEIHDNGTTNPVSIVEGGGIKGLRQKIEQVGGSLQVECQDGVHLHLNIPLSHERMR